MSAIRNKVMVLATLKEKIRQDRLQGKMIAFTNGCFDILHAGHVFYLEKAKATNRVLIIGLNSDHSVRTIKGPARPIVPQEQRAHVLGALASVDYVTLFDEPTPENLIKHVNPDILIKGADWKGQSVAGEKVVKGNGGHIEFIDFTRGCSSTNIIQKIVEQCAT